MKTIGSANEELNRTLNSRSGVSLGQVFLSEGVKAVGLRGGELTMLLRRHQRGDWGLIAQQFSGVNERALREGTSVLSAYCSGGQLIYVLTEADRSGTRLVLASECMEPVEQDCTQERRCVQKSVERKREVAEPKLYMTADELLGPEYDDWRSVHGCCDDGVWPTIVECCEACSVAGAWSATC